MGAEEGSFLIVIISLDLTISCFNHFFKNKASIELQLFFSSSGNSSNHSLALLNSLQNSKS